MNSVVIDAKYTPWESAKALPIGAGDAAWPKYWPAAIRTGWRTAEIFAASPYPTHPPSDSVNQPYLCASHPEVRETHVALPATAAAT